MLQRRSAIASELLEQCGVINTLAIRGTGGVMAAGPARLGWISPPYIERGAAKVPVLEARAVLEAPIEGAWCSLFATRRHRCEDRRGPCLDDNDSVASLGFPWKRRVLFSVLDIGWLQRGKRRARRGPPLPCDLPTFCRRKGQNQKGKERTRNGYLLKNL
jgi:hypothetical protein